MRLQFGGLNITSRVEERLAELGYTPEELQEAVSEHKSGCDGEPYCGEWDSEEDFARHIISECYNLEREMGNLSNYFDYEAYGRELFMYDYNMGANNHVFRRI